MCGRYAITAGREALARQAGLVVDEVPGEACGRYNVAPGQSAPILTSRNGRKELVMAHWGIPGSGNAGRALINARRETVDRLPLFAPLLRSGRVLALADGFYEWGPGSGGSRTAHFFELAEGGLFALAGLWRAAPPPGSYVILTTRANAAVAPVHFRMPVLFTREGMFDWIDGNLSVEALIKKAALPFPPSGLRSRAVGPRVHSPRHDDPACLDAPVIRPMLFPDGA